MPTTTANGARIAYAVGLITAPTQLTRTWFGPPAFQPSTQIPLRGLAVREIGLATGGLLAALGGGSAAIFVSAPAPAQTTVKLELWSRQDPSGPLRPANVVKAADRLNKELAADCLAVTRLGARGRTASLAAMRFFAHLGAKQYDDEHPTGTARARNILECLPE